MGRLERNQEAVRPRAEFPTLNEAGGQVRNSSGVCAKPAPGSLPRSRARRPRAPQSRGEGALPPFLTPAPADTLLPAAPQITRASTTGQGATTTSSRKVPPPRRLRRLWTCPSCRRLGRRGRPWAAWSTRCPATTLRARRSGSLTFSLIPPGTRPVPSLACPGLCTPCRLRFSGPARPSRRCRSTAGRATGITCPTPPK